MGRLPGDAQDSFFVNAQTSPSSEGCPKLQAFDDEFSDDMIGMND
jgi:hypothetical protein